jgi:hypothetical protein
VPVLKLTVITTIMIYDNDEYNSPFQLNYSLVSWGINSNHINDGININNKEICAYPDNTERNKTQTKDNIIWKLLLQNNIKPLALKLDI